MKLMMKSSLWLVVAAITAWFSAFGAEGTTADTTLTEPAKSVLDNYLAIQKELAKDSIKGLSEHAKAISKAAKSDQTKTLPPALASQAETLANARDLKTARQSFKPLSALLIKYLADSKAGKGTVHEAYCPMAKASWLQTEKDVRNPYYGKSMLDCGELKN